MNTPTLEQIAALRTLQIHEPFAEFLHADPLMHSFEISLLDCYRMAGHACHAITGSFLVAEAAIENLFPETKICERGDLIVEFGSALDERATGPRSNVISFITGAWGSSGFPGLKGKFKRKDLISYGHNDLKKSEVRFRRLSNGKVVVIEYDSSRLISGLGLQLNFPDNWRVEIYAILNNSATTLNISNPKTEQSRGTTEPNGCC
jgi:hypothetical protein